MDRLEESHGANGRRAFLSRMGAAGFGAAALALLARPARAQDAGADPFAKKGNKKKNGKKKGNAQTDAKKEFPGIPGRTIDEVILNFALTLEILEADLYRQALNKASGKPVGAPLGKPSDYRQAVANGNLCGANVSAPLFMYLKQFTFIEAAHRDFLRAAIRAGGGTPVAPNPGGYRFPGGLANSLQGIMTQILPLEETGVRAYLGALPFFTNLNLAQTAGGIYSTECRHSGAIRVALDRDAGPERMGGDQTVVPNQPSENTLEYFLEPKTVIQRASTYFA